MSKCFQLSVAGYRRLFPTFVFPPLLAFALCGLSAHAGSPAAEAPPPRHSQSPDAQKVARLLALVEAAEAALSVGDENSAQAGVDEAESLISNWHLELLKHEDVEPLINRLDAVRRALGYDAEYIDTDLALEAPDTGEEGLDAEKGRVVAAEADTMFDFPIDLNDKVLKEVAAITTDRAKEHVQNAFGRGSRYLPMIHRILAEEGLPLDLAYLPFVESRYKNEALSPMRAMGMWQFIPSTGQIYGLRRDSWIDERRDPEKATRAAARFLKKLYEDNDDWYLALAGYNAGQGRVTGAIQGTGSRNFWDHARSKYLRTETKNYIPKMCAAVLVGKHPERFGLAVPPADPYEYETVDVGKSVALRSLSRASGLHQDALNELNPELVRRTTPPRVYALKVPVGRAEEVAAAVASLPTAERLEFRPYKIQQGDTLAKVAARYRTTPEDLLDFNGITRSRFRVGRTIRVPVVVKVQHKQPQAPGPARK